MDERSSLGALSKRRFFGNTREANTHVGATSNHLVPPRPETVARAHVADLRSAYAVSGLDVVELRAVYASLPTAFENDGDGRKRAWAEGVREKLVS